MPAGTKPLDSKDPVPDGNLLRRIEYVTVELDRQDRRLKELEGSVYGRPDQQRPGVRGELNIVNTRLEKMEQSTASILLMVRLMTGLLGVAGSGIWALYSQGGGWPF